MRLCSLALLLLVTTSSLALEETVKLDKVKCGKATFQCIMRVSFKSDCSAVTRVVPSCAPKKSKCTKGVPVSFVTKSECRVTGTFKSNGKKQSVSGIDITTTTTTTSPTTTPPSSPLLRETADIGQIKCKKVTFQQCKMEVTYTKDCSSVSKVVPQCTPKRSKCIKGVSVSFETQNGCTVKGMFKSIGTKQSMSKLAISTTTTSAPPG